MRFLHLGASLYVPATRPDLVAIGNLHKYPHLRSVIFCTEDSIHERDLPQALLNIEKSLRLLEPTPLLRFIRVRNAAVLRTLLQISDLHQVNGFVFPKVTRHNLEEYFDALRPEDPFVVMPTLETTEAFDATEMVALRQLLLQERYRRRVLSLRIGGNDLLNLLGIRRPRGRTIYATPLRAAIDQLVTIFRPHGFNLTGPVWEYLNGTTLLTKEARADLSHGLFGKAAIHPAQVPLIENQYRVSRHQLEMAERILAESAPAVFRCHQAMCEPATHRTWAELIHQRAILYGVKNKIKERNGLLPKLGKNGIAHDSESAGSSC